MTIDIFADVTKNILFHPLSIIITALHVLYIFPYHVHYTHLHIFKFLISFTIYYQIYYYYYCYYYRTTISNNFNFYLRLFKIFLYIHNFYLLHFAILRLAATLLRTFTIHKCSQSFVHFVVPPIKIHVSQLLQTFYSAGGFKPMELVSRTS